MAVYRGVQSAADVRVAFDIHYLFPECIVVAEANSV